MDFEIIWNEEDVEAIEELIENTNPITDCTYMQILIK